MFHILQSQSPCFRVAHLIAELSSTQSESHVTEHQALRAAIAQCNQDWGQITMRQRVKTSASVKKKKVEFLVLFKLTSRNWFTGGKKNGGKSEMWCRKCTTSLPNALSSHIHLVGRRQLGDSAALLCTWLRRSQRDASPFFSFFFAPSHLRKLLHFDR